MAKDNIKKTSNAWAKLANPLRNLTTTQIQSMLALAKLGNDVDMQLAFYEMERIAPIYGIVIQKRLAGILNRKWDVKPRDESEAAKRQSELIKEKLLEADDKNEDGLTEALRHLGMASFRGRSFIKPFIRDDFSIDFKKLSNWNVLVKDNKLLWNPECCYGHVCELDRLEEIPKDEVCYVQDERPIDVPGLTVYLRQLVGEEQWARFVEKEGVPQVLITAPDGTPDTALDEWTWRANNIVEGGSGVLPGGAHVDQLTAARGQDPFSAYCEHQMEMIVLLACGEKMTTLGGATGLGSNTAEIQSREFQNLVSHDCKRIQNAINACVVKKFCRKLGQEVLCRFTFVESDYTTPAEYLDLAAKAQALGLEVDVQKLRELTNLSFISESEKEIWRPKDFTGVKETADDE